MVVVKVNVEVTRHSTENKTLGIVMLHGNSTSNAQPLKEVKVDAGGIEQIPGGKTRTVAAVRAGRP
jgi:hypothetical protein